MPVPISTLPPVLSLAGRRDRTSRALFRALWTTALRRAPSGERAWLERIEARRRELAREEVAVAADFPYAANPVPGWAEGVNRPAPLWAVSALMSVPARLGRLQMRLVRELEPRSCLELGTGVGISAAYQAAALELNGRGTLTTVDAARRWSAVAAEGISRLGLSDRVEVLVGPIRDTLPATLERMSPIDYAFIDAEHTEAAMIAQFEMLLPRTAPGGVLMFDDIDFSAEMQRGWRAIHQDDRLAFAISLGRVGVAAAR